MTQTQYGGLQVEEDIAWERRSWVVERVFWVAFAVIILAGLLGLFGPGLLGGNTVESGGLSVDYPRFARYKGSASLDAVIAVNGRDEVRVVFESDYLREMSLEAMHPDPASVESGARESVFVFRPQAGAESLRVWWDFKPEHIGKLDGSVRVEGGDEVSFTQFIYP